MDIMHLLFSFQGRTRRLHFWMAGIAVSVVFGIVEQIILRMSGWPLAMNPMFGLILLPIELLNLWILLALGAKRCHDRDKSAWWVVLFYFVPVIGWIWGFIEMGILDGTPGSNRFGPSPKGVGDPIAAAPAA